MGVRVWPHRPNPNHRNFRPIRLDQVTITTWALRLTELTRKTSMACIAVLTRLPRETSLGILACFTEMARMDRFTRAARITTPRYCGNWGGE